MLNFLEKNVDIRNLGNFKTKAEAKYFFEIKDASDIDKFKEVIKFCDDSNIDYKIIGGGTNILFAFDKFDGVIIKNSLYGFNFENNILTIGSAEVISNIAEKLETQFNNNIWHRFIGLPGTVGGAIYGNAGCFGLETMHNFLKGTFLRFDTGEIVEMSKDDLNFSYRNSILKETRNYFTIEAVFDLSFVAEKYSSEVDNIDFRENKQPKGNSCGSFFKNGANYSAGKMIDELGLKGYKIGGAYISEKHSNFLMSDGNASYSDIINLMNFVILKVKEKYSVELIPEVQILKNKKQ